MTDFTPQELEDIQVGLYCYIAEYRDTLPERIPQIQDLLDKVRRLREGRPSRQAPGTRPYTVHPYAGASKERAERGAPGHCERCVEVGHVKAHPSLGCGDVRCEKGHDA